MLRTAVETVHFKNDLRRLTLVIGVALTCFGVLLLAVVAFAGWSANRTAEMRERQLVENALNQSVSRVLNEAKAIAWWDEAVLNVQAARLDIDWLQNNIGAYFNETYGHDEIYVVNGDNQPIYANVGGEFQPAPGQAYARQRDVLDQVVREARGSRDSRLHIRDGAFTSDQARYDHLLGAGEAGWSGHIFSVDGAPAVVAAIAIVPSVDASVLVGEPHLMVSIVRIDAAFMADVGRTLLTPDLTVAARCAGGGFTCQQFLADDGAPVGQFTWTPKRPGQSLLIFILPLLALGVFGVGLLTAIILGRLKRASLKLADSERSAIHEAKHDPLSGLPNRCHFIEKLQEDLDRLVQTRDNSRAVVAYIDVDRFKDINDTLGHHAGDTLIMTMTARLKQAIGQEDFLARFGGDEFAVLRRASSLEDAVELADRLRGAFAEGFDLHSQELRITATIGVVIAPDHGGSPHELMRHADIALYQGKAQGRDRTIVFSAEMAVEVEQRREIELDLQAAIERGELALHYQPLVSCSDHRIRGLEALLRWRHPDKGDIPPGVFVSIAEEAGLMPALGAYVLARAFAEAKAWPELEIAINLSPVQFRHVDLLGMLRRLIAEHDVDPSRFVLEVTEGVLMESSDRNLQTLEAVRGLGFKVALDDFGTGYSSLRYLCDTRFDKIKIDRAFVSNVHERKRAMTIIQAVVTLGRGLGMAIVAEGVETEAEASIMRLVGATELQGYYFSPAVPAEEVAALVRAFNTDSQPNMQAANSDARALARS